MDPASVATIIGHLAIARGVDVAVESASAHRKKRRDKRELEGELKRSIQEALSLHTGLVSSWSEVHKPLETPRPLDLDESTIPLDLTDMPRRYKAEGVSSPTLTEEDLLTSHLPLLLIGDPGAGKTTTIKRLCRTLLTHPSISQDDAASYPLLIECREHDWTKVSLVDLLCNATGFPSPDDDQLGRIARFLNATGAYLFIDGLDEVAYRRGAKEARMRLVRDIRALGHHLRQAQILVSCRSGSAPPLDNYQTLELCALDSDQIQEITRARLGDDSHSFLSQLSQSPIQDVATRPLLLSQVIVVFQRRAGQMPKNPSVLYRKMIKLLLEEWDEAREISRRSMYAGFGPDEKMQFLSELSYRLTINGRIRFATDELIDIYDAIHERWGLPQKEARKVAKEIETHTGLIVQSGEAFEFSHLSLQEYLCAEYLVKVNDHKRLSQYIDRYPDPLAIATALASEPNSWLTQIVMKKAAFQHKPAVRAFVHRLGRERPAFNVDVHLGHTVLKLMFSIADEDIPAFRELATMDTVRRSVAEAIQHYEHSKAPNGVDLRYNGPKQAGSAYSPARGRVSMDLWNMMLPDTAPKCSV